MAKKITVLLANNNQPEIAVEFTGRGPGEETPYYQGKIHAKVKRKWEVVGHFYNDGRGGMTFVDGVGPNGRTAVDRLAAMAREAFASHACETFEPEGQVIGWAELIGYELQCSASDFTLADYTALIWCEPHDWDTTPKTPDQLAAHEAARSKHNGLVGAKYAAKGKTAVETGPNELLVFKTRDRSVVESAMTKRGGSYTILA